MGVGAELLPLLLHPRLWMHRRVHTLEYIDPTVLRRSISNDFTHPAAAADVPSFDAEMDGIAGLAPRLPSAVSQRELIVPVISLQPGVLVGLDVRDEAGASIPVLTRAQSEDLMDEAFQAILAWGEVTSPALVGSFREFLTARTQATRGGIGNEVMRAVKEAAHPLPENRRGAVEAASGALIQFLDRQYPLLISLPKVEGRERRVVKVAFTELAGTRKVALGKGIHTLGAGFGIQAESIHLEIRVPPGLRVLPRAPTVKSTVLIAGTGRSQPGVVEATSSVTHASVAHLYVPLGRNSRSDHLTRLSCGFQTARAPTGMIDGALIVGLLSAVIATSLAVARFWLEYKPDGGAGSTIVAVLPTIIAGLVSQLSDGPTVRWVHRPVRIVLYGEMIAGLIGALPLIQPAASDLREVGGITVDATYIWLPVAAAAWVLLGCALRLWLETRGSVAPAERIHLLREGVSRDERDSR